MPLQPNFLLECVCISWHRSAPWMSSRGCAARTARRVSEQGREAHRLTYAPLDGARARQVVEVGRDKAWVRSVDLDACGLKFYGEGEHDSRFTPLTHSTGEWQRSSALLQRYPHGDKRTQVAEKQTVPKRRLSAQFDPLCGIYRYYRQSCRHYLRKNCADM
jgi:hypothetical protein